MAEKKRLRDKKLTIFLLEEELEILKAKCDEFGISYSDYFRQLITFGSVKQSSKKDSKEEQKKFMYEVNRIGGNINQIAHRVNSNRIESKKDYEDLMMEMSHLFHSYSKAVKGDIDTFNMDLDSISESIKAISEKKEVTDKDIQYIKRIIRELRIKFNEFMKVGF
ncbi:MAG: MobC family plasmid mobilization relaxosome protein [Butyrivibrio sp.]|nr:MobC family plasmid mobilization relaxosome protein [Butyrivibrio sp.]